MIKCSKCGGELGGENKGAVASISGSIMGDEYTDTYFFCEKCGVYSMVKERDRFCGEEVLTTAGPLSKEEGDQKVALIRRCKELWNKRCRCEAHISYFGPWLD
jgi:hypothetical protein